MPIRLSKSELLAYRQCERRLWLELYRPHLRQDGDGSLAAFADGHALGDIARRLYDPDGRGVLLDPQAEGFDAALARSRCSRRASPPAAPPPSRTCCCPSTMPAGAGAWSK